MNTDPTPPTGNPDSAPAPLSLRNPFEASTKAQPDDQVQAQSFAAEHLRQQSRRLSRGRSWK